MSGSARDEWLPAKVALGLGTTWVVVAAAYVALLVLVHLGGDVFACALPGDSNYGALSWSTMPPGPVCTWYDHASATVVSSGPSAFFVVVDLVLTVWLAVAVASVVPAIRHARRRAAMASSLR